MGGKGTDVSLILATLGVPNVATGLVGGDIGRRIDAWLRGAGAATAFVEVAGESRVNTVILEVEGDWHTTLCAEGLRPTEADVSRVWGMLNGTVAKGDVVVLAGSAPEGVPHDVYAGWIPVLAARGARVILDSSGASLAAGAAALPWALKPNREELAVLAAGRHRPARHPAANPEQEAASTTEEPAGTPEEAAAVARDWVKRGVELVVASLGAAGAVAVAKDGAWYAPALDVPVVNPAGAGDAMVAAMAMGAARGEETPAILASAVALASAVVMTEGTAECSAQEYLGLRPRVKVERV
jgi:fructose-1-phosphate kinase PfkB-like protein